MSGSVDDERRRHSRRSSDRAAVVLNAQDRLRALLMANAVIASELSLPRVLRHIVSSARELGGARYAAVGVLGPGGVLDEFVHDGMDDETVRRIGELPRGLGILGLLSTNPSALRLRELSEHPDAVGFPPNHPPMTSFLGVPIRIRDHIFGNLYLTESVNGEFSVEDEQLVAALATSAGVAIENARLYKESEQRHRWLEASAELTQLLFAEESSRPLDLVIRFAAKVAEADTASLALTDADGQIRVHSATGEGAGLIADRILDADRSLSGRVIHSGKPILVADYLDEVGGSFRLEQPVAAAIGVPLLDGDRVIGAVTVARLVGRSPFTDSDMDQLAGFANHAGVAIELDRGRADRETVRLLSDHDRIAADLHDLVIQELFATGMGLQSMAHRIGHAAHRDQLLNHVDSLDATIRRIRATIFRLQQPERTSGSLRRRVQAVLDEAEPELGLTTEVTFSGPLDDGSVSVGLTEDIVAVLREALSNVARHADASRVDVRVALVGSLITVDVVDNGTGIGPTMRAGGILTMQRRAERRAGQLDVSTPLGGGTRVFWTAQTS